MWGVLRVEWDDWVRLALWSYGLERMNPLSLSYMGRLERTIRAVRALVWVTVVLGDKSGLLVWVWRVVDWVNWHWERCWVASTLLGGCYTHFV
jgi:hypothetical protein